MDTAVIGLGSRRGRKRKINNVTNATLGVGGKRKALHTRSFEFVGRYVQKKFKGGEILLGRITNYDSGLYRINYEDGRCEDVIGYKVKAIMVKDGDLEGEWPKRKEALNKLLLSTDVNPKTATFDDTVEKVIPFDSSSLSGVTNSSSTNVDVLVKVLNDSKDGVNADSSSESCESALELEAKLDVEVSLVPPPELPPSSGHIGIPEEYVPHLLSVYSFLRSFSVRLFLYPFELDEFVGALNCSVANTLLDSVHVALICFLKRQFEKFPSDDSELASKVLRCLDWSLLDSLTWPVYLVYYLMAMGYKEGGDRKELYGHCLDRDYYTLSVGKRLIILQILCDNVLDTEELRAEIDMRETSEAGMDTDTLCEPARVNPGYSKSSDYKDIEAAQTVEKYQTIHSLDNQSIESQVSRADEDGYGDECRLCGMDGILVCCDGCPSAYHSRCLGLNKMPSGSWHCPECKVDASNPKFLRKTTLRGADVLGVDPYNQVFVASCDHLLVLKTWLNCESCPRYYNRHDIPGVLSTLYAKPDHAIVYSEICKGLMQYWEFPADIPANARSEIGLKLANQEGSSLCIAQLNNLPYKVPNMSEVQNNGTCASGTSEIAGSLLRNSVHPPALGDNFFDTDSIIYRHADSTRQQCGILKTMMTEPPPSSSSIGQPANPCASSQQRNLNITGAVSRRRGDIRSVNDTIEAGGSIVSQKLNRVGNACGSSSGSLYTGSSFSRTGYINLYLHGDFSATAAANLATLSHEENQVSECISSDNHQKVMCDTMPLQVKAFASAAVHFFWPIVEEKLADVPRERCSWCFSCKAPAASKRGCLLNAAASNATRGAMKVLFGVQPVKNGTDDRLSGIGTYIMFMEERLSGLLVGPFLNNTFRKQWRRQLEQATTCSEIKILLLELEVNTRSIAFSGDWTKLVEGFSTQSSTSQIATGSTQKCRPGRRGKKQLNMAEVVTDGFQKKLTDFTWWRGGMVSKLMFQRGIIPSSLIQNAARQGGKKRIAGVRYVEGIEIPRISRQLIWRSAVESSRTVAHLALQVRYLDVHVRWGDLGRPELICSYGKGSEAEASAFRNAFICGKKIVDQEVRYCVSLGSRKHLPSRVMKNITEIDQILENGKERYWFSETFIPLNLIREYEQKVEKNMSVNALSKLQRRQLKASREDIFSSLLWKQGNVARNCCSCHQDFFHRNAAKCHACQGFCHQKCATTSTVQMREEIDLVVICKLCCQTQVATQVDNINGSPTKPLLLQGQGIPYPVSTKDGHLVCSKGSSASFGALECLSEVKSISGSASTKKIAKSNWGLIWRKKNCEDTGFDFRLKNILMRSNTDRGLIKPLCRLCDQPYNPNIMYIRCETCKHWFHADSVELDESKVFSVVGYKCCKCRRIKSPVCPYAQKKNVLKDKIEYQQAKKPKIPAVCFNRDMIFCHHHHKGVPTASELPRKAEIHISAVNNPVLASPNEGKQCPEGNSEGNRGLENANASPGPRKLPVRRHASQFEESFPFEANVISSTEHISLSRSTRKKTNLANYSSRDEVTNPAEANAVISMQESLLQQLASDDCFDIETNVGGDVNGKEPPESIKESKKTSSPVPAGNVTLKVCHDEEKPIKSTDAPNQRVPCKFCSEREVGADACCRICGMWIHKSCSPWYESSSLDEDGWRCGSCRDWC